MLWLSYSFDIPFVDSASTKNEDTIMITELFFELNEEQQEVVTGGASLYSLSDTAFTQKNVYGVTYSTSTPYGSATLSYGEGQKIKTNGYSDLSIYV
jgi:hypothetical protein